MCVGSSKTLMLFTCTFAVCCCHTKAHYRMNRRFEPKISCSLQGRGVPECIAKNGAKSAFVPGHVSGEVNAVYA